MNPNSVFLVANVLATAGLASIAVGQGDDLDCPSPESSVTNDGWVTTWFDSTYRADDSGQVGRGGAPGMMYTEQLPFDRQLKTLPLPEWNLQGPLTFMALVDGPAGNPVEREITLQDPVIMATWDFNVGNETNPTLNWENYRPIGENFLREYTVNGTDGETLMWFSPHGQMNDFMLDQLGLERECFNPLSPFTDADAACDRAILNGMAFVGVPYANAPLGSQYSDPDNDAACPMVPGSYFPLSTNPQLSWWRDRLLVFVAERSAFIRPSFNPTTGSGEGTAEGRPGWDPSIARYRFPNANEGPEWNGPSYQAFLEETMDFVGYQNVAGEVKSYQGPEGFKDWYYDWKTFNSWGNTDGNFNGRNASDIASCPYYAWPFSGLGLSVYWPATPDSGPVDYMSPYSAASEFISVGEQNLYLVAIREAHTYLGSPDLTGQRAPLPGSPGQSWCDLCPGDFNQDGLVDGGDLAILLTNWGSTSLCYMLDRSDPVVNGNDLAILLSNWNSQCSWPLTGWRPPDCGNRR